ncbi:hypothetical protein JOQ06_027834 [Pogonophryne albipinna]|uniref:ZP domain-containing protein n=1 Tax=Pogonophryne albipinna TaxID=1090488 RepID=A0AAD6F307_9TELE|nr:hypothetical protein JOQ06_027834 [Pogonophryne albipinna]
MLRLGNILLWMAAAIILCQARPNVKLHSQSSSGLRSDCAANVMRLSLDKALAVGNQLEVEAINGTKHILLTPSMAAQCGYSMESDPWGNTIIYTSLMGCFVDNKDDATFNVGLRLQMYGENPSDVVSHYVSQTCSYTRWASREILCHRNYMEVGHLYIDESTILCIWKRGQTRDGKDVKLNANLEASGASQGIWKMTFYTPEPVAMVLQEAEQAGYAAKTTSSRLVMRSSYNTAETYSEDVAGVPMEVFRVSAYYMAPQGLNVVNLAAACPKGGVLFTEDMISWHVPRQLHMGINGQRLDRSQMAARGYTLSTTDFHIVVEIPVGSPDGYYKSHAPDYQYHITYFVEPMLEVLWREDDTQDDTRYKVLFPIMTPLMPQSPQVKDDTVPETRVFSVLLGTFLHDVELRNITFSTGVLTVEESNAKGFTVQEHSLANGSKSFSLQVPFDADVVLKHNPERLVTSYFLPLIFGLIVLPEETPFALPNQFYISVKFGSHGSNFKAIVGPRELTAEMAEDYNFYENGTHLSLILPYTAKDAVFELLTAESVKSRIDLLLLDRANDWVLADLYLACYFPLKATEFHPNGTMTAVAVKVESTRNLKPSQLTLKDQSCTPQFSDDRFAYFSFSVDTCGTTRTTQTVAFSAKPRTYEPAAEIGTGQLMVQMRLSQDPSYELFYQAEDYPVVKYLQQRLYFEVELMHSTDPHLEVIAENCWATLYEDRTSLPSWDIIVCENRNDSYATIVHPVVSDSRVLVPSHIKRFSVKMFTFTKDDEVLKDQIYVHCDAVICDTSSQADGSCRGQCVHPPGQSYSRPAGVKKERRSTDSTRQRQISSGAIILSNL